jgi:thiamine-monophosphate kinase
MKLSSLGEFGLIELIRKASQRSITPGTPAHSRLILGIGDDAAAWRGSERVQLATTDSLIENVHFTFSSTSWRDLGHKSLAVNLSDIAAMGGTPTYAFVSICCPPDIDSSDILDYYEGLNALAARYDVIVAGGNLTRAPVVNTTVFVTGEVMAERMLTRSAARLGQAVAVTGSIGGASATVAALRSGARLDELPPRLTAALLRPEPRLKEARVLADAGVECAIDVSDGLLADLTHICEASDLSAVIEVERVPLHPDCVVPSVDINMVALGGGEDYELLVAGNAAHIRAASALLDTPITIIGRMVENSELPRVTLIGPDGKNVAPIEKGWNHFQS